MPKAAGAKSSKTKLMNGRIVSAKSKTGNPACSQAMSSWVRSRHGGPAVGAEVFKLLAKCRSMARQNKQAQLQQASGKLAPGRGTWQRSEQAQALQAQRMANRPAPAATPAYVRPSSVDSPAQAALASATKAKQAAHAKVQALRRQGEGKAVGFGPSPLEVLKAKSAHGDAIMAERAAKKAIERRASELGQTTTKPTPTPPSISPDLHPKGNASSREWWNRLSPSQRDTAIRAAGKRFKHAGDYDRDFGAQSDIDAAFRTARDARDSVKSTAPATPPKPSLRQQADAARAAKGTRKQRLEALISKAGGMERNAGRKLGSTREGGGLFGRAETVAPDVMKRRAANVLKASATAADRKARLQAAHDKITGAASKADAKPFALGARGPSSSSLFASGGGKTSSLFDEMRGAGARDLRGQSNFLDSPAKPKKVAPARGTSDRAALAAKLRGVRKLTDRERRADKLGELDAIRQQARATADKATAKPVTPEIESRVRKAFDAANASGNNFVKAADLRARLTDLDRPTVDATLRKLRLSREFTMDSHEGIHGPLSRAERRASVKEGGSTLSYVSRHPDHKPSKTQRPDAYAPTKTANPSKLQAHADRNWAAAKALQAKGDQAGARGKFEQHDDLMRRTARLLERGGHKTAEARAVMSKAKAALAPKPSATEAATAKPTSTATEWRAMVESARLKTSTVRDRRARALKRARSEQAQARRDPSSHTDHKPGTVTELQTSHIHFDPHRFQYKLGHASETGSVGSLAGVKKYDPNLGGVLQVWKDPANGKTYVVNGHNRLDLARKLNAGKVAVRFIDAKSAEDARSIGALTNIAEGRGSSLDAAKFFRDTGHSRAEIEAKGIPLREKIATEGLALSGLDRPIFDRVVRGELTPARGAIIGGAGLTPAQQKSVISLMDRQPKSKPIKDAALEAYISNAKASSTAKKVTRDLFGENEEDVSLGLHRANLAAHINDRLSREKRVFGTVAKSKNAADLKRGNNQIDTEASGKIADEANQNQAVFKQLRDRSGPVAKILNESAERIHNGEKAKVVYEDAYKQLPAAIQAMLRGR